MERLPMQPRDPCMSIAIFEEVIDDEIVRVYAAFVELTTHQNRRAGVAR